MNKLFYKILSSLLTRIIRRLKKGVFDFAHLYRSIGIFWITYITLTALAMRIIFCIGVIFSCIHNVNLRRLRSVDKQHVEGWDSAANSIGSVEYIWSTTTVAVGDTAVLHCSFDAIFQQLRSGNIDWVKESTPLKNGETYSSDLKAVKIATGKQMAISDRRYRVYRPHNSALSVLIIRRTKKHDAGIYRCNLAGSSTRHKFMVLNVTESKIEAQTSPNKIIAKAGTDVALWCNATGYPKPVVYWTREDRTRKLPDGNEQFWGNELYFEKACETDTGIYTCYVDNFVQPVVSYKFSLMVEDNPWYVEGSKMRYDSSQWYPQDSPDPRPVRGRSYLLLCETRGSPQPLPSISWYRDGRPLRNSRHFYIIEDSPEWKTSYTSSTLVIMRFKSDYQGNYTCVASNAFRMKKQTFQLTELASTTDVREDGTAKDHQPEVETTNKNLIRDNDRLGSETGRRISNPRVRQNQRRQRLPIPHRGSNRPDESPTEVGPSRVEVKLVGLKNINMTEVRNVESSTMTGDHIVNGSTKGSIRGNTANDDDTYDDDDDYNNEDYDDESDYKINK